MKIHANSLLALALFLGLTSGWAQAAPPANDLFANRQVVAGTNISIWSDNTFAELEPGEPSLAANLAGKTLWYSWTAPFTGHVGVKGCSPSFFPFVAVFVAPTLGAPRLDQLQLVCCARDIVEFVIVEGTEYFVQLDGCDYASGDLGLALWAVPFLTPTNDQFADAAALTNLYDEVVASVVGATLEPGEPAHLGGLPCKSVWWRWQAPVEGTASANPYYSRATNVTLAIYVGPSVDRLALLAAGQGVVSWPVRGGETYYIAGIAPEDAIGDVSVIFRVILDSSSGAPPGNLLCEGSFENTALNLTCWHATAGLGGHVNDGGGAHGSTWVVLLQDCNLWQEFPTVPGRTYRVRFAYKYTDVPISVRMRIRWDGVELGIVEIPGDGYQIWYWQNYLITATNTTSRLTFENLGCCVSLDAVSVVWLSDPPVISRQPVPVSAYAGAAASFQVAAFGAWPLSYQWFYNDDPLPGETNIALLLDPVRPSQAGPYHVVITNAFGSAVSTPATLTVQSATSPTIVLQPYSETVASGGYFALSVAAVGTLPLSYQWSLNGQEVPGATNRQLVFSPVDPTNGGTYTVRVWNSAEAVWSLPATLQVAQSLPESSAVRLANPAPVYDLDGMTKLSGSAYVAQLYAGPSLAMLRAMGTPTPFQTGANAGFVRSQIVRIPTVPPRSNAVVQIRAWEQSRGASYEEARALGGKFGRSEVCQVLTTAPPTLPARLPDNLPAFRLEAGLPQFTVGQIALQERREDGTVLWSLRGEADCRYLIERAERDFTWHPLLILTNSTGATTFVDPKPGTASEVFYRARILD
jgi:hypothetical protein